MSRIFSQSLKSIGVKLEERDFCNHSYSTRPAERVTGSSRQQLRCSFFFLSLIPWGRLLYISGKKGF